MIHGRPVLTVPNEMAYVRAIQSVSGKVLTRVRCGLTPEGELPLRATDRPAPVTGPAATEVRLMEPSDAVAEAGRGAVKAAFRGQNVFGRMEEFLNGRKDGEQGSRHSYRL